MREPWDDPTYAAWRIYVDYLLENGGSVPDIKRAVKYALGLRERPKLALTGIGLDSPGLRMPLSPGTEEWLTDFHTHSWWTGEAVRRSITRTTQVIRSASLFLATPADFPGMLDGVSDEDITRNVIYLRSVVHDFYRKCSEKVAVRCRQGVITVRHGRSRLDPWQTWNGD